MPDETVWRTMLFDFYGDLLTDKQREYYDLHYNQDLSLAEIAASSGISRQGVWDNIRRADAALREAGNDFLHQCGLSGVLVAHKGDGGCRRARARPSGKWGGEFGGDDLGFLCLDIDLVGMGVFSVSCPEAGTPAFLPQ